MAAGFWNKIKQVAAKAGQLFKGKPKIGQMAKNIPPTISQTIITGRNRPTNIGSDPNKGSLNNREITTDPTPNFVPRPL